MNLLWAKQLQTKKHEQKNSKQKTRRQQQTANMHPHIERVHRMKCILFQPKISYQAKAFFQATSHMLLLGFLPSHIADHCRLLFVKQIFGLGDPAWSSSLLHLSSNAFLSLSRTCPGRSAQEVEPGPLRIIV